MAQPTKTKGKVVIVPPADCCHLASRNSVVQFPPHCASHKRMKPGPLLCLALALSGCTAEPEPDPPGAAVADSLDFDTPVRAQIWATFNACEAELDRRARENGQTVLDYQHGPADSRATRIPTGWRADISATVTHLGSVTATCIMDENFRVLDFYLAPDRVAGRLGLLDQVGHLLARRRGAHQPLYSLATRRSRYLNARVEDLRCRQMCDGG